MTTPVAILIGAIILAGTMAFVFRYDISPDSVSVAHRFDRWTGKIQLCAAQNGRMVCADE
jgi:hypothetical protein